MNNTFMCLFSVAGVAGPQTPMITANWLPDLATWVLHLLPPVQFLHVVYANPCEPRLEAQGNIPGQVWATCPDAQQQQQQQQQIHHTITHEQYAAAAAIEATNHTG